MSDKLIKNMNDEVWRKFIAYCALNGTRVNEELERILKGHLNL
jgi:hypothetical protein